MMHTDEQMRLLDNAEPHPSRGVEATDEAVELGPGDAAASPDVHRSDRAVVGIVMKMSAALREGRYVPFGPFLAGAGIAVMLAGQARVLGWLGWA